MFRKASGTLWAVAIGAGSELLRLVVPGEGSKQVGGRAQAIQSPFFNLFPHGDSEINPLEHALGLPPRRVTLQ
jgi:hypothetical protein